jgi:putative SOS response-associated peptidase YedK
MCGRYTLSRRQEEIVECFGVDDVSCEVHPRYNIAPTQQVAVIMQVGTARVLDACKWGLMPAWMQGRARSCPIINARAETLAQKPFFKQCISRRRCLIPADGFYEWRLSEGKKLPVYAYLRDRSLFALAGLWDECQGPDGVKLRTCAIITTAANGVMSPVHNRMPVILSPQIVHEWLDPAVVNPAALSHLLRPYEDALMQVHEVSTRVNSPAINTPELTEAVS